MWNFSMSSWIKKIYIFNALKDWVWIWRPSHRLVGLLASGVHLAEMLSFSCHPCKKGSVSWIPLSVTRVDLNELVWVCPELPKLSCKSEQTCTWSGWDWCHWSSQGSCPSCWTLDGPSSHTYSNHFPRLEIKCCFVICKSILLLVKIVCQGQRWL